MRVLVAGGAGYIGSITSKMLLDHGHEVVVFDNLSRGHRAAVPSGAHFIHGELGDVPTLRAAFRDHHIDTVMHFAAHSQVGESREYPERYFMLSPIVRWAKAWNILSDILKTMS